MYMLCSAYYQEQAAKWWRNGQWRTGQACIECQIKAAIYAHCARIAMGLVE